MICFTWFLGCDFRACKIYYSKRFKRFVKSKDITISFGIALAKPSKPISYLAHETEHLLEESKDLNGKDAITLFGETL